MNSDLENEGEWEEELRTLEARLAKRRPAAVPAEVTEAAWGQLRGEGKGGPEISPKRRGWGSGLWALAASIAIFAAVAASPWWGGTVPPEGMVGRSQGGVREGSREEAPKGSEMFQTTAVVGTVEEGTASSGDGSYRLVRVQLLHRTLAGSAEEAGKGRVVAERTSERLYAVPLEIF